LTDALKQLRPEFFRGWLDPHSGPALARPSVYLDDEFVGDVSALQTIPLATVREARLLRPSQAKDRYGSSCHCEGGVIVLRLRRVSRSE
jgi:hypothetical protein